MQVARILVPQKAAWEAVEKEPKNKQFTGNI